MSFINSSCRTYVACLVSVFALTGCVTTHWEKPGGTQGEYEQVRAACMLEGHDRVIPREHTVQVSGGSYYTNNKCKGNGCSSSGGYTPPQYAVVDENEDLRNQVVRACLFRNGWQEVRVDDGFLLP